jgi:methyl-accepting chemotaxis protein
MKKLSVGKKLYLAFGIVIILTIIVGGVSILQLKNVTNTFVELQTKYFKITDNAMEASISLLTARHHEKDFIARKDKKYIGRMEETLSNIQKLTDEITEMSTQLGQSDIAAVGPKVIKAKNEYKVAFGHVAKLMTERGNKTEGIAGELRKHAHDTEEAIKALSADKLMIDYLTLRRHEKDLLLREDMKYVESAQKVLKSIEIHAIEKFTETESSLVMKGAKEYLATFEKLAGNIADMKKNYPVLSKAAHEMEALLEGLEISVMEIVDEKQAGAIA